MPDLGKRAYRPYRWTVILCDRAYRLLWGLDRPEARVGLALCVKIERTRRHVTLPDGTRIRRGDRVGVLHLNNARVADVHLQRRPSRAVGIEFRRWVLASLHELARLAEAPGPLARVRAFTAITIFHRGLARFGFQIEDGGLVFPALVGAYQRALLACLHPAGVLRDRGENCREARRLWLTREALLARYSASGPRSWWATPPCANRAGSESERSSGDGPSRSHSAT